MFRKLFSVVTCVTLFVIAGSAIAAPAPCTTKVGYELTLDFSAPTWSSQQGYISSFNATRFDGCLKVNNLLPGVPVKAVIGGKHTFGDLTAFDAKDEWQAGIEYALGASTTFFSYYKEDLKKANNVGVYCGLEFKFKG
jgi:hypothetical protein